MPITAFAPTARPTPLPARILSGLRNWWKRAEHERRLRATIHTLHGLNDRTLRDIGIERGHIDSVIRERCRAR